MIKHNRPPVMTDPLGRYWEQPSLDEISFSLLYAYVSPETFNKLKVYQTSTPTGVYDGKMWTMKAYCGRHGPLSKYGKREWLLCWYENTGQLGKQKETLYKVNHLILKIEQ